MRRQKRRLGLKKETLVTLAGLDADALARVVGGTAGYLTSYCGEHFTSTSATSLSGSKKC